MNWTTRVGKWLVFGSALSGALLSGACLTRPVGTQPPTTKDSFTTTVSQAQVDKVDLLFMIDNSSSMGDKQSILSEAVPNLIQGLLKPNCVTADGKPTGAFANPLGTKADKYGCAPNDPEFKPVTDMHLAVVSSSLGSFGGDVCPDTARFNDHAHLLNIVKAGGTVPDAQAPSNFLAWFPQSEDNSDAKRHPPPATPVTDVAKLSDDFGQLVVGVDQTGCGLEAQLESFYHFLIAPNPWNKIVLDPDKRASYGDPGDIDLELLQQRADFLRQDSLVAIIMLTDEDDSSPDPLSVGGQGWAFDANQFPGSNTFRADGKTTTAPRGTSTCKTNPGDPACTSCGFATGNPNCANDPTCAKILNDSECKNNGGYYGAKEDALNVRYHRMKERFGIDPQYPIKRYVDGLAKTKVADRDHEHVVTDSGGHRVISGYAPITGCTNPLFAMNDPSNPKGHLPRAPNDETCLLTPSTRTSDLVFFAVVGGVPNQLLYQKKDGSAADGTTVADQLDPTKRITPPDWKKILGQDPINFNYDGIDPHMVQSVQPRNLPGLSPASSADDADVINGREWDTADDDLQYACIFPLPPAKQRPCAAGDNSCDCNGSKKPPLCNGTTQVKAKAYPTIREFEVVRALGDNGIIASLCPLTLDGDKNAAAYGYNPAVAAIIERLKNALTTQCLPQALCQDQTHPDIQACTAPATPRTPDTIEVPCLILAQLPDPADSCANYQGIDGPLQPPPTDILDKFRQKQKEASGNTADGGLDLSQLPVCVVPQDTKKEVGPGTGFPTCKDDPAIAWCYVTGQAAGRCPQAVLFSTGSAALGAARFSLQCIEQFSPGQAARHSRSGALTATKKTILIIEDEPHIVMGLRDALEFEGFGVIAAGKGKDGLALARGGSPDAVILDLMLPDMNGYGVCEELRRISPFVPIIMLTARSQETDKIRGLDSGADDYVTKPFSVNELIARMRAILRRASRPSAAPETVDVGDAKVSFAAHTLKVRGVEHALSFYEVELLRLLVERAGQPVSRDEILQKIWGLDANPTNRTVDNFIVKLRKKIEIHPDKPAHILTVYGYGYKLATPE